MQNYPPAQNDDAPSFMYALIGFLIPIVGLILWLVEKGNRPLKAMSALKGAGLSVAINIVLVLGLVLLSAVAPRRPANTIGAPGTMTQPQ